MDETIEKQKGQLTSLFSHYYLDIQYSFHFLPMLIKCCIAVLDHNSNLTALAIIFQGYIFIFSYNFIKQISFSPNLAIIKDIHSHSKG